MKVVIVDDEINATDYLVYQLQVYQEIEIKAVFNDACKALAYLLKNPCDVLFLDIDMPNISGIYIAEQITGLYSDIKVCFVTAYNEFAVKAFELSAIDYILKPYTKERLELSLDRLKKYTGEVNQSLNQLSDEYHYDLEMICGYDEENIILINYHEIFYIETLQGSLFIHTKDKIYKGNKTLNFYEEKLNKRAFFRTHKCYLANLSKVDRFKPRINYTYDMYFKEIKDVIPISRNKVKEMKLFFNQ
ncbi:LytTR family DNA-binding domain-containing protein [Cellulosilyticum sp. ST5]|uniref:LytR/AlgR family response regulator transcription factor n=1 Tax=Cellulosilyticum sp. ST5 TaxID=3055805 RepID=UPI003977D6AF